MLRSLVREAEKKVNKTILLKGWVNGRRNHGKVVFIDLRDRSGIIQVVADKKADKLKNEDVIEIQGEVKLRPASMINSNLATGKIEIQAKKIKVLAHSKNLPFSVYDSGYDLNEALRLKYRYLDLRRPRLAHNLRLRAKIISYIRNFLQQEDFVEIEFTGRIKK